MELIGTNWFLMGAILLAGLALGYGFGLRAPLVRARARQLEGELEDQQKENERTLAEIQAGRQELERAREGLERYRGQVADHFAGTSERRTFSLSSPCRSSCFPSSLTRLSPRTSATSSM